jgi:hypothetical protein
MSERITISEMEQELIRITAQQAEGLTTLELAARCNVSVTVADRWISQRGCGGPDHGGERVYKEPVGGVSNFDRVIYGKLIASRHSYTGALPGLKVQIASSKMLSLFRRLGIVSGFSSWSSSTQITGPPQFAQVSSTSNQPRNHTCKRGNTNIPWV